MKKLIEIKEISVEINNCFGRSNYPSIGCYTVKEDPNNIFFVDEFTVWSMPKNVMDNIWKEAEEVKEIKTDNCDCLVEAIKLESRNNQDVISNAILKTIAVTLKPELIIELQK